MNKLKKIYHFISPRYQTINLDYKYALGPRYGKSDPHKQLYTIINSNREEYKGFLQNFLKYLPQIHEIKDYRNEMNPDNPVWNNGFLPGLDIIALYVLIAELKPEKFIEIGSGNSTKVAFKAIQDQKLRTEILSVDPQPRAEIDRLANTIIRKPFENTDLETILNLRENDILFIDNSHRILPGSDATVFFMEILPQLKKGVIVHIHDVYLPYDYPQFMCERAYSEQYGLAFYLLANSKKYNPLLPNFFISEDVELSKIVTPLWNHPNLQGVEKHGGSFWLRISE